MIDPVRQEVIALAHTVVVKVGTNVLTRADGTGWSRRGCSRWPIRFSASATAAARSCWSAPGPSAPASAGLVWRDRPTDLRHLQACAAVGQAFLMRAYEDCLAATASTTAQILLTAGDFDNRARYLNARNTILTLFEWDCLPIINENDTVSVAEIRFGDNDHLAAMVTNLLQAPLLILLTIVDGLFSARSEDRSERAQGSDDGAAHRRLGLEMAGGSKSASAPAACAASSGPRGWRRRRANRSSWPTAVDARAFSTPSSPREPVGTLFLPHGSSMPAWKRWLGYTAQPRGRLVVDAGARRAVEKQGRSLLPIGVVQVTGSFGKGDVVALCDPRRAEFARGLTNYPSPAVDKIRGLRTDQIGEALGACPYEEVVHRDNLVVIV